MAEKHVHQAIVNYLKMQYPNVLFRSDSGAGIKLTIGQAKAQKSIQKCRAWPDLFIAHPVDIWHGMFIELKDEGVKLTKKDGSYASEHIEEQSIVLSDLTAEGYYADFAVGFNEAKKLIDNYLAGKY